MVSIPPFAQGIFILTLNQADVIGDQSDAVTQNAWFRCVFCAAISGEISILIQTRAESWGRYRVPRICRWESKKNHKTQFVVIFPCDCELYNEFFMKLLCRWTSQSHQHLLRMTMPIIFLFLFLKVALIIELMHYFKM